MTRVTKKALGRCCGVAGLAILALGCERPAVDARLETLAAGITKDSAVALMGGAPQRTDPYLTDGKSVEALYFRWERPGEPVDTADRAMTPLIFVDGALAGWGWAYWDSLAGTQGIQVAAPPVETR